MDKYFELAGPVIGDGPARALLDACWSLETLESVHDLPIGGTAAKFVRAG